MFKIIYFLLFFVNYIFANYDNFESLAGNPKYNVSWTIDNDIAYFKFEVKTLGWVSILDTKNTVFLMRIRINLN